LGSVTRQLALHEPFQPTMGLPDRAGNLLEFVRDLIAVIGASLEVSDGLDPGGEGL
jgi:hypothetical protein